MYEFAFRNGITRAALIRLEVLTALFLLIILMLLFAAPAHAGNTTFLTDKNGNVVFPLSPPNRSTTPNGPGLIDNMTIGATTPRLGTFSQIIPAAALPTIASGACGTGANGAVVAGSTSQSLKITIGAAATTTCTILFAAALAVAPIACTFSPMNAAAIGATVLPFIAAPTTGGVVFSGSLLANTNWSIMCL